MTQEEMQRLLEPDEYHKNIQNDTEIAEDTSKQIDSTNYPYSVRKVIKEVTKKYAHLNDGIPAYMPIETEESTDEFIITRDGRILSVDIYSRAENNGGANGYPRVILHYKNGVRKAYYKHRLLGKAFREYINNPEPDKPFNEMVVNHIDGIKTHCYVTDLNGVKNIEVVTQRENTRHAYRNNLIRKQTKKHAQTKNTRTKPKEVCCIDPETNEIIQVFPSVNSAANELGCPQPQISRALNNPDRDLKAGGFKWKLKKDM